MVNSEMYDLRVRLEDAEKNLVETDNEIEEMQKQVGALKAEIENLRSVMRARYETLLKVVARLENAVNQSG